MDLRLWHSPPEANRSVWPVRWSHWKGGTSKFSSCGIWVLDEKWWKHIQLAAKFTSKCSVWKIVWSVPCNLRGISRIWDKIYETTTATSFNHQADQAPKCIRMSQKSGARLTPRDTPREFVIPKFTWGPPLAAAAGGSWEVKDLRRVHWSVTRCLMWTDCYCLIEDRYNRNIIIKSIVFFGTIMENL